MSKNFLFKLKKEIGEHKIIDNIETCSIYSRDESKILKEFLCNCVVFPHNSIDVQKTLKIALEEKIPLTPRGGGTGVSGGAIPVKGGIILSFERMNKIKEINENASFAILEPGVILKNFQDSVEKKGFFYAPDPASLENCTIGGNVATNAGGPRALKYGVTKNYVLEMEVVFPDGEIKRIGKKTLKWNAGYDLIGLFTGSEGTLCIITEITLKILPLPPFIETLLIPFKDENSAIITGNSVLNSGILPRALEFVGKSVFEKLEEKFSLPSQTRAFLLIELDGEEKEIEKHSLKIASLAEKNNCIEIFAGIKKEQREKLWKTRRDILPLLEKTGFYVRSEDVVVKRTLLPSLSLKTLEIEKKYKIPVCNFGHIGDGNLHINFLWKEKDFSTLEKAVKELYETVVSMGGTISGEHGIGFLKRKYLSLEQEFYLIELQKKIKRTIDPYNILNPGKIFP